MKIDKIIFARQKAHFTCPYYSIFNYELCPHAGETFNLTTKSRFIGFSRFRCSIEYY